MKNITLFLLMSILAINTTYAMRTEGFSQEELKNMLLTRCRRGDILWTEVLCKSIAKLDDNYAEHAMLNAIWHCPSNKASDIMKILLNNGVNVNYVCSTGTCFVQQATDKALSSGNTRLLEILLDAGADTTNSGTQDSNALEMCLEIIGGPNNNPHAEKVFDLLMLKANEQDKPIEEMFKKLFAKP